MNPANGEGMPALTLVATPIGNARDITLRALDLLAAADVLAAEDTRSLRRLMDIHGLAVAGRPCLAYHEHNGAAMRPKLLEHMRAGRHVVYASEAGTPMISDPGFDLVRAAVAEGLRVSTAPGAAAAIAALTVAGLPTDRFLFAGFLPSAGAARRTALTELRDVPATLVLYESPRRLAAMLVDAGRVLGGERAAVVCRELTKTYEEARRDSLDALAAHYAESPARGEVVVVIDRGSSAEISESDVTEALKTALETMSVRDAADTVAAMFKTARRPVYQQAMQLQRDAGLDE